MQLKLAQAYKVTLPGCMAYLVAFCAITLMWPDWGRSHWIALAIDTSVFTRTFKVEAYIHHALVIATVVFFGSFCAREFGSYVRRLFNSLREVGLSWHHYIFSALVGGFLSVTTAVATSSDFDRWYWFTGDGFLLVLVFLIYGIFILPIAEVAVPAEATLPQDIIGVSIFVDYVTRRIVGAFDREQGPLPKTLAISGERGSGKSYVLEKVQLKLISEFDVKSKIFKPWNFDSHTLFYEEVMGYLFSLLEDIYVVPKPKAMVNNYIRSFCDDPKKVVGAFSAHLMGDFSSEKRSLQDAEMWIKKSGKVVLIFDDLDRCHQSELRGVFRLMDRLTLFENIFVVASIDDKTLEKVAKFEMRTEIPVKVTS